MVCCTLSRSLADKEAWKHVLLSNVITETQKKLPSLLRYQNPRTAYSVAEWSRRAISTSANAVGKFGGSNLALKNKGMHSSTKRGQIKIKLYRRNNHSGMFI